MIDSDEEYSTKSVHYYSSTIMMIIIKKFFGLNSSTYPNASAPLLYITGNRECSCLNKPIPNTNH